MTKDFKRFYVSRAMFLGTSMFLASIGMASANPSIDTLGSAEPNSVVAAPQQNKHTIKGVVEDQLGPIAGANVVEKGTTNGTITDMDGNFSLEVAPNSILVVSFIGYKEQQIPINNQKSFTIKLVEDFQALDEVVVVGYGTQKKVNLTGAVSSVDFSEQAANRPITNVSSALGGLSAGLQVMQSKGNPTDDGATIRVRGTGTLNNASPLVLVDGMEASMDAVNPQDIESISVLKDAASAAIYGSRAANGVILITTKKGNREKIRVTYSGTFSVAQPSNLLDFVSDYPKHMRIINEMNHNITGDSSRDIFSQSTISAWEAANADPNGLTANGVPNWQAYPNTNWNEEMYQNNLVQDHVVSVNGGSEKVAFLLSAGYMDNPGLVENTGVKRYTMRANVEANVTKWLILGTRTYAIMNDKDQGNFDDTGMLNFIRQTTPGLIGMYDGKLGYPEAAEESATANNMWMYLKSRDGQDRSSRFNTTMYSKIKFMEGLSWDFNFNYGRRFDEYNSHTSPVARYKFSDGSIGSTATTPDQMSTTWKSYAEETYTLENILRYDKTFKGDHDLNVMLGYNEYYYKQYEHKQEKKGLIDPSINVPDGATEMIKSSGTAKDEALRSVFGRLNYAYKSKYLFEANFRYDGSSRFNTDSRWGIFPSFSAAWRISEEDFMKNIDWLSNLKIRASWGQIGNNRITDKDGYQDYYGYQATYATYNYSFGGKQMTGLAQNRIGNTRLEWEGTTVTNFGLDASFLNNRLTAEIDVYNKVTDGILTTPNLHLTMGIKTPPTMNTAEVTNRGVEMTLGWKDKIGELDYAVSANFSYNHNEVTKYLGEYKTGWIEKDGKKVWQSNIGEVSVSKDNGRIVEGHSIKEYYTLNTYSGNGSHFNSDGSVNINGGPKDGMIRTEQDMKWLQSMMDAGYQFQPNNGIGPTKINYGDLIYADVNGDGIYGSSYDYTFQGSSAMPKFGYGINISAGWKGFDLSMLWAGNGGFELYWEEDPYNSVSIRNGCAVSERVANDHYFYDPTNPSDPRTNLNAYFPRLVDESNKQSRQTSNFYLYNGSYMKLKNLTIGYTLPANIVSKIFAERVRVYVSGENLFTITSFPGQDPEMGAKTNYPSLRQFAGGINVTF